MKHSYYQEAASPSASSFKYKPRVSFRHAQVCGAEVISDKPSALPFAGEKLHRLLMDIGIINSTSSSLSISVAMPAQQLMDSTTTRQILLAIKSGLIHNGQLELLLSDIFAVADQQGLAAKLQRLADAKVGIIMSDFGSGFSALDSLTQLPFTGLMLNGSMVRHLNIQEKGFFIVEAAIRMARNMGLTVMADGAQNTTEFGTLVRLGCEQVQGDWIGQPLPLRSYLDFVQHDPRWGTLDQAA